MADEFDIDDIQRHMDGALAALKRDFSGLRTGQTEYIGRLGRGCI